ncbi:MAG: HAD-IIIA family hydrolase [Flavobacteriales bacterium]
MLTEAIILAGGLGTRLRSKVKALPKSMAPINNIPFLAYQLGYLSRFGIKKVYLAVGYLSETIVDYFGNQFKDISLIYVHEDQPLGTGGAIVQSLKQTVTNQVLICNGDTMFDVDLNQYYNAFEQAGADFYMALKPMENFDRYGIVNINSEGKIIGFEEKKQTKKGLINGGLYLIDKSKLLTLDWPKAFSFESGFLETKYNSMSFGSFVSEGYFLDIGVPSDYEKAQQEFKTYEFDVYDTSWTLFLDRDGVINVRNVDGYITSIDDFQFIDGAKEAIARFSNTFGNIIIVTNQQCVGKGILQENALENIHKHMIYEIEKAGGRIDRVYFAPQLASEQSKYRKPNSGMADFPEIVFEKSIIVGDSISDMQFGQNKTMKTVFISPETNYSFDFCFPTLSDFGNHLQ